MTTLKRASSPAMWPSVRCRPRSTGPAAVAVHHAGDVAGHAGQVEGRLAPGRHRARRPPAPTRSARPQRRAWSGRGDSEGRATTRNLLFAARTHAPGWEPTGTVGRSDRHRGQFTRDGSGDRGPHAGVGRGRPARRRGGPSGPGDHGPGRGRVDGRRTSPHRPGRHRDRQVPRLSGAGGPVGQAGRRRHGDQGAPGPAGAERPAPGGGGAREPFLVRRAEGAQQLPVPAAGARGRGRRHPAAAVAVRAGRRAGARREPGPTRRGTRGPDAARRSGPRAAGLGRAVGDRRPGRPVLRAPAPRLGDASASPPGSARAPSAARPAGPASPRRRGPTRPPPTSSSSTPTSTAPTWRATAPSCPSTTS